MAALTGTIAPRTVGASLQFTTTYAPFPGTAMGVGTTITPRTVGGGGDIIIENPYPTTGVAFP